MSSVFGVNRIICVKCGKYIPLKDSKVVTHLDINTNRICYGSGMTVQFEENKGTPQEFYDPEDHHYIL